ncbi:MAG: hypothetical protein OES09_13630 [Gammaproteobacteria bacterium]|nr:hypothetical protein [Gammaproteobacteria bacterium]
MTVKLLLRPCVWVVFCKNLRKVSVVYEDGSEIVYHADPSVSDFLEARERLLVEDDSTRPSSTLLTYRARLIPKFVVPPLIGPWLIKRQIMRDLRITSGRVEFLAAPVGHDPAAGLQ